MTVTPASEKLRNGTKLIYGIGDLGIQARTVQQGRRQRREGLAADQRCRGRHCGITTVRGPVS